MLIRSLALPLAVVLLAGCALTGAGRAAAQAVKPHQNRLARETSPYLRQHAHNPVDWYPWGEEAFKKAREEKKPVFLSVGYAACHWCHVMERESFESEEVGRLLNEHFVAIKVDREERPDVDEIYMTAVQMIQGNGGWPMSVFLTPEAEPFFGGTYYPRDRFLELLRKVAETWRNPDQQRRLIDSAKKLAADIGASDRRLPGGELNPNLVKNGLRQILEKSDDLNGGFGGAPKFPPSVRLALMLERYRTEADGRNRGAILRTLDRMARGGLQDHVGGGFHRYCVDAKWLVPHFEKMLYDNALLAEVYLEASRLFNRPDYARVARRTLDFALRELRPAAPAGRPAGFWSSLDADSLAPGGGAELEEGRFYTWTPAELEAALGAAGAREYMRLFGIGPKGNFEGRSIPNLLEKSLPERAREAKAAPEALQARVDAWHAKLLALRAKRPRPRLDDKVLASSNGLMIRALAAAYDVLGEERYRRAAEDTAVFVLESMRGPAAADAVRPLRHSWHGGRLLPVVFLEDYASVLSGLSRLHSATGEERWLREGVALSRRMLADFQDEQSGVLSGTPKDHEKLIARLSTPEDGPVPAPQALAARSLVELGRRGSAPDLAAAGRRVLEAHTGAMRLFPGAVSGLLLAAHVLFTAETAGPVAAQGQPTRPNPVELRVEALETRPKAGEELTLALSFDIGAGWHVNTERPGAGAYATRVELLPGPFKLKGVDYPPGKPFKAPGFDQPLQVWEGKVRVRVRLTAAEGVDAAREVRLAARYQACNDEVCLRPANKVLAAPLPPAR